MSSDIITRHAMMVKLVANPDLDSAQQEHMALAGLLGELGEVAELLKKARFHSKPYYTTELKKELGDVMWYLHYMCITKDLSLTEIIEENITKLQARYPGGFTPGGGIRNDTNK